MNWLQRKLFRLQTGADIEVINNGQPVEEYIIRFKEYYIHVLEGDSELNVAWSDNPAMFHVPIREFWTAVEPSSAKPEESGSRDSVAKESEAATNRVGEAPGYADDQVTTVASPDSEPNKDLPEHSDTTPGGLLV